MTHQTSEVGAMPAITGLVITFNEAANIERTLSRMQFLPKVIVLDSGSTDGTLDIAARFSNVEIVQRAFDSFAGQCNFGLGLIRTE
ncbi:glycosyltransferase, partial [Nostoc sp. NIES-2111]